MLGGLRRGAPADGGAAEQPAEAAQQPAEPPQQPQQQRGELGYAPGGYGAAADEALEEEEWGGYAGEEYEEEELADPLRPVKLLLAGGAWGGVPVGGVGRHATCTPLLPPAAAEVGARVRVGRLGACGRSQWVCQGTPASRVDLDHPPNLAAHRCGWGGQPDSHGAHRPAQDAATSARRPDAHDDNVRHPENGG